MCCLSSAPEEVTAKVRESLLMDLILTVRSPRASPRTSRCPRADTWATSRTMKEQR